MKTADLVPTAVANTFRSKTRTLLTILAIFVGAFTLALTSGLGTGINSYIDDTVAGLGSDDVMTVTPAADTTATPGASTGPAEYDPEAITSGIPGYSIAALTLDDLDTIEKIDGIEEVQASRAFSTDYISYNGGTAYSVTATGLGLGATLQLADGDALDNDTTESQVVLPVSFVEPLGFDEPSDALGKTVTVAVTDLVREQHLLEATVVGVSEEGLVSATGTSIVPNSAFADLIYSTQNSGAATEQPEQYSQASARFDANADADEIATIKDRLADAGYAGSTVDDQLGAFKTVIDGLVLGLNAFAAIALLAASFGIINTLYMSVQERTREIGLMKAMGMSSGKVFGLFSLEAAFIGFLGSAIGALAAVGVGVGISSALASGPLSELPGLTLIAFDPLSVGSIILLIMAIAFVAGTLPAARAAKADPVTSLRYE